MRKLISQSKQKISFVKYIETNLVLRVLHKLNQKYAPQKQQKMAVFAHDWVGANIYVDGVYEEIEIAELIQFINNIDKTLFKGAAIDIGANIGNHTIEFSKVFSEIFSFEPHPDTYELLRFNTKHLENVSINNVAIGSDNGTSILFEDKTNLGGSSLVSQTKTATKHEVKVKTLDDALPKGTSISLLKIDVEGFELNVLEGAKQSILQHQPIIAMEQNEVDFTNGQDNTKALRFLSDIGYTFFWSQTAEAREHKVIKLFKLITSIFTGRTFTRQLFTGDILPAMNHSLIICLPSKFQ